jgi:hypothetical protein
MLPRHETFLTQPDPRPRQIHRRSFVVYAHDVIGISRFTLDRHRKFVISNTGMFGYRPRSDRFHPFVNFMFVFAACVLIVQYTMRLHHHPEKITQAKNAQLQKVNSQLDRFVYSAPHDLRAPLSSLPALIDDTSGYSPTPGVLAQAWDYI